MSLSARALHKKRFAEASKKCSKMSRLYGIKFHECMKRELK